MFTIKQEIHGHVGIYGDFDSASYNTMQPDTQEVVGHRSGPGGSMTFTVGTIYVVNENGKTVGKYVLGEPKYDSLATDPTNLPIAASP